MLTKGVNILKLANNTFDLNRLSIILFDNTDILAEFSYIGKRMVQIDKDLLNGIYFVCMLVPFLSTFLAIIIDVKKSIVNVSKRHSINRLWA